MWMSFQKITKSTTQLYFFSAGEEKKLQELLSYKILCKFNANYWRMAQRRDMI